MAGCVLMISSLPPMSACGKGFGSATWPLCMRAVPATPCRVLCRVLSSTPASSPSRDRCVRFRSLGRSYGDHRRCSRPCECARSAGGLLLLPWCYLPTPTAPSMGSGTLRRLGSETSSPVRRIPDTTVATAAKTVSANSRGFDIGIATRYNAWVAGHFRARTAARQSCRRRRCGTTKGGRTDAEVQRGSWTLERSEGSGGGPCTATSCWA